MEKLKVSGKRRLEISGDASVEIPDGAEASLVVRPAKDMELTVTVGKGCSVDCLTIGENSGSLSQENRIGEGSVVRTTSIWLSEGSRRMSNILQGERSEAYDMHLFVGRKGELGIDSTLRHAAEDTKGDVLVKGVVYGSAYAGLEGMVKIDKGASGAESFIAEHVLLLSPDAHARARPQLEIEDNDVNSRHAASVTPIDDDKIFYLASRGIGEEDAKKLIVEGFMLSALEGMEIKRRKMLEWLITAAL